MKKEINRKNLTFRILLCIFFPVGICYLIVWALKKLIVMADSEKYEQDLESDRERMEFVLAGEPEHDVQSYLSEGVRLDIAYSPERDMHTVTSGQDYVGYIDRRDTRRYENFSPTSYYVKNVESINNKIAVTIIVFK